MRLRQSLSSTNKILYKQDNQRYVEQVDTKQMLMPQSSLKKLTDLQKKATDYDNAREEYNQELFKDEDLDMAQEENLQVIHEASVENTVVLEAQNLKKRVKFDEAVTPNFEFGNGKELQLLT